VFSAYSEEGLCPAIDTFRAPVCVATGAFSYNYWRICAKSVRRTMADLAFYRSES
jgi:hypothetical protein